MVKESKHVLDFDGQTARSSQEPELVGRLATEGVAFEIRAGILGHIGYDQVAHLIESNGSSERRFIFEGVVWLVAAPKGADQAVDKREFADASDFTIW